MNRATKDNEVEEAVMKQQAISRRILVAALLLSVAWIPGVLNEQESRENGVYSPVEGKD